jgi:hypothetical protein
MLEKRIVCGDEITPEFEKDWTELFARAYKSTVNKGQLILRKYKLNDSKFCVLYVDNKMVASYSGLELPFSGARIFVSTDTMSDGTIRGATVVMANHLYEELTRDDVLAVCGFPNDNIRKLREKRLGWVIDGKLFLWIGVPIFWRILRFTANKKLWKIRRPERGFFRKKIFGLNLLGRDGLYSSSPGICFTLSAKRPGFFFVRIPSRFFPSRTFGYRFLTNDSDFRAKFLGAINNLDVDTIDVP